MLVGGHRLDDGVVTALELQPAQKIHAEGVRDGCQHGAQQDVIFEERYGPMLEKLLGDYVPREDEQQGGIDCVAGDYGLLHTIAGTKRGNAGRSEKQEQDALGDKRILADVAAERSPNEQEAEERAQQEATGKERKAGRAADEGECVERRQQMGMGHYRD